MQKLSIYQLKPNMIAAENVLDFNKRLILEKGTVLNDILIERLLANQIISIYVEDTLYTRQTPPVASAASHLMSKTPLPDLTQSYSERVRQSEEFKIFKANYEKSVNHFRGFLNDLVERNTSVDISVVLQDSLDLISSAKGKISILDMLQNMRDYDDDTYAHSLNVGLICNVLAGWLKLNDEEIELATACGLFHDIGKLKVPPEVIRKPSRLSMEEYLQVREHTVEGYKILREQKMNAHMQNAALMHHERMDGTGYPLNLKGNQIDRYASLVAIADVYDAMTSKRVYRAALCPFTVIEIFEQEGFQRYDTEFLLPFLDHVVNTYLQNRCELSDGRIGTIVYINKDQLSRPTVDCDGQYVDLSIHPELKILRLK